METLQLQQLLLEKATQQENYLLALRESCDKKGYYLPSHTPYQYERAKLIGMVDMLSAVGIDTDSFNWIY